MGKNCVFCKIATKEIKSSVVFEDDDVLAFKDLNPEAPVHVLIIPKKHIETLDKADREDVQLLGKLLFTAKEIAGRSGSLAGGYRTVINCNRDAGQEVFHLHVHLLGGRKFSWPPG
ncbi:MAG: histidine triad nucleotide-binding protein [Candidatus Omnitrophica bacterium]|nr:histidine triad nucleotide-binding protein [Candidatus Omnitrophota bacterium]